MLVEDSALVRLLIAELLREAGAQVMEASTFDEALAVAAASPHPTRLLIADLHLGQHSGIELSRLLYHRWPGMRTLLISADPDVAAWARVLPETTFLEKTFLTTRLVSTVQKLLKSG